MSVAKDVEENLIDVNVEEDVIKVIQLLTKNDKDLPLKTEIDNPLLMTSIDVLTDNLKGKLPKSYATADAFRTWFRINMVSKNRKSRAELIEALRTLRDYANTRLNRWLGRTGNE